MLFSSLVSTPIDRGRLMLGSTLTAELRGVGPASWNAHTPAAAVDYSLLPPRPLWWRVTHGTPNVAVIGCFDTRRRSFSGECASTRSVQPTATVAIGRRVTGPWSTGCNLLHLG
jgi:hypothetical protein